MSKKFLSDDLKKLQDKLDLKKRFPGYFNKNVFRGIIVVMLLFTIFVYWTENFQLRFVYAECDKDHYCNNPFYVCPEEHNMFTSTEACLPEESVPKSIIPLCEEGLCDNKTLAPHQILGHKPNALVLWYNQISLLIVILGFALNHLLWRRTKWR